MGRWFGWNTFSNFHEFSNHLFSPANIIAIYTVLSTLIKMKRELGLEAMLEYLGYYHHTMEAHNPQLKNAVARATETLGCFGLSRTDMIIADRNKIFVLEINTLPFFNPGALYAGFMPVGLPINTLLDMMTEEAIARRSSRAGNGLADEF